MTRIPVIAQGSDPVVPRQRPPLRRWRATRLNLIAVCHALVILALGTIIPLLFGGGYYGQQVVLTAAPLIIAGSMLVAHHVDRIRRLSNNSPLLVVVSGILLGASIGTPFLTLATIEAIAGAPVIGENPVQDRASVVVLGFAISAVWAAQAVFLMRPETPPSAQAQRIRRISVPVAVVLGIALAALLSQFLHGVHPAQATASVVQFGISYVLVMAWSGGAGYVLGGYLIGALTLIARIHSNRDGDNLRPLPGRGRGGTALRLTIAAAASLTLGWMLTLDRFAAAGFGVRIPENAALDWAGVPHIAITVFMVLAVVFALLARGVRRTSTASYFAFSTCVLGAIAIIAAWLPMHL
ncbi:hypothetical protein D9V32_06035 [Mycetocola tolaasinivorans]|uniref:Uncharacterized protein n=1 Tax=Mycetocola tolaasinivorans TaxID=76635 RepID=A0A3L7A8P0_9MICO|nr:hypothetical protein [Mycetocola tolaasinivorans]RLP76424.1 hypothetical protein D9V32_06035 [Mycetocola tolaasinivorans]